MGRFFYGEFAGAAAGYVGSACGCVAGSGPFDARTASVSYRRLGGVTGSYAFDCMDAGGRAMQGAIAERVVRVGFGNAVFGSM